MDDKRMTEYKDLYKKLQNGALIYALRILADIEKNAHEDDKELHENVNNIKELIGMEIKEARSVSERIKARFDMNTIEKLSNVAVKALQDTGVLPKEKKDESKV